MAADSSLVIPVVNHGSFEDMLAAEMTFTHSDQPQHDLWTWPKGVHHQPHANFRGKWCYDQDQFSELP